MPRDAPVSFFEPMRMVIDPAYSTAKVDVLEPLVEALASSVALLKEGHAYMLREVDGELRIEQVAVQQEEERQHRG